MSADDATHMAAGLAYYSLFSIFPLLLFLIAAFGLFLDPESIQSRVTDASSVYFPGSDQLIGENLNATAGVRGALGAFGILGLLWSGSAVFGAVSRSVNRAWDIHIDRPFFINKPRQLGMAAGVGLLFLGSLSMATLARAANRLIDADAHLLGPFLHSLETAILQALSFGLTAAMFILMYKFMPNTRTQWRYIWPGAISAAVLFEVAKTFFVLYLTRFTNFENVYGALTPVIVLSLWSYLSGLILIFGAELSSEYGRMRLGTDRGVLIQAPNPPADAGV